MTGSGPVIGSVASSRQRRPRQVAPLLVSSEATTAAPQPPSNPPSKYTLPFTIHHSPLHLPFPSLPPSSPVQSSACISSLQRMHHPPWPCTASADLPTRLPLHVPLLAFRSLLLVPCQQTLASSHWRSFSRAAWCSSEPETVAPSQLPRLVHRSLISVPPALPCRLQTDLPSPLPSSSSSSFSSAAAA